jgi:hypothetical protein|nr:MAG TPA: hypothetical protein [Bacteriophage sp.]
MSKKYKGLAIIPVSLNYCEHHKKEVKPIRKLIHKNTYYEDLVFAVTFLGYDIIYFSTETGLLYYEDTINSMSSYENADNKLWQGIITEEIVRLCIELGTIRVLFLGRSKKYKPLIETMRKNGLIVRTPFIGLEQDKCLVKLLRRGKNGDYVY